jgi:aryl-alcohol dehydrogenase-like predicted oxidoreductase
VHIWDARTPIEETMRALDDVVRAGKVLYIGVSDAPAWIVSRANTLAEWRGWTAFAGLQVPYSLLQRDIERELLPMAEGYGMTVAGWSPLAGGVLSGKFTRPSGAEPGTRIAGGSLTEHDHAVARAVAEVADRVGATPSQVAIAWTMAHSEAVHPIVGARRLDQLLDNIGAVALQLAPDDVEHLERATGFSQGFPARFIQETTPWVLASAAADVDGRLPRRL